MLSRELTLCFALLQPFGPASSLQNARIVLVFGPLGQSTFHLYIGTCKENSMTSHCCPRELCNTIILKFGLMIYTLLHVLPPSPVAARLSGGSRPDRSKPEATEAPVKPCCFVMAWRAWGQTRGRLICCVIGGWRLLGMREWSRSGI